MGERSRTSGTLLPSLCVAGPHCSLKAPRLRKNRRLVERYFYGMKNYGHLDHRVAVSFGREMKKIS